MSGDKPHSFRGRDRLEFWPVFGRFFRRGSPAALAVSDADRVRTLLEAEDAAGARRHILYFHSLHRSMIAVGLEWALRWPAFIAERLSEHDAARTAAAALTRWKKATRTFHGAAEEDAVEIVGELLSSSRLFPQTLNTFVREQERGDPALLKELAAAPDATARLALQAIGEQRFHLATEHWEFYFRQMRARHDLLLRYVWCHGAAVNELHGQRLAEDALEWTLQSCAFNDPLWAICQTLSPEELAAVLAEHLRAHFSGEGRDGAVEIIEESDCYRLVFAPCGSGGAMRRDGKPSGAEILADASPATWGRAGEVPVYCAHCAQNELSSVKRLGYPAWVAEFNPDPTKPCGWTVYKDPERIPEAYFTRLGVEKKVCCQA